MGDEAEEARRLRELELKERVAALQRAEDATEAQLALSALARCLRRYQQDERLMASLAASEQGGVLPGVLVSAWARLDGAVQQDGMADVCSASDAILHTLLGAASQAEADCPLLAALLHTSFITSMCTCLARLNAFLEQQASAVLPQLQHSFWELCYSVRVDSRPCVQHLSASPVHLHNFVCLLQCSCSTAACVHICTGQHLPAPADWLGRK